MERIDCNTVFGAWPSRRTDISLNCLLDRLDRAEISRAFTCSTTAIFYNSARGNDETLEVCEKNGKLLPTAVLHPNDLPRPSVIENLKKQGFHFLRLYPNIQGWPADYYPLKYIFEGCSENDFPIMVQMKTPGFASSLIRLLDKYPAKLIFSPGNYPHGYLSEALSIAADYPNVYLETRLFASAQAYKIFSEINCDQVCFGTGTPLYYPESQRLLIDRAEISEECRAKIYSETIKTIAGIK